MTTTWSAEVNLRFRRARTVFLRDAEAAKKNTRHGLWRMGRRSVDGPFTDPGRGVLHVSRGPGHAERVPRRPFTRFTPPRRRRRDSVVTDDDGDDASKTVTDPPTT